MELKRSRNDLSWNSVFGELSCNPRRCRYSAMIVTSKSMIFYRFESFVPSCLSILVDHNHVINEVGIRKMYPTSTKTQLFNRQQTRVTTEKCEKCNTILQLCSFIAWTIGPVERSAMKKSNKIIL